MYVRFVNAAPSENANLATGIFIASQQLIEDRKFESHEVEWLEETHKWFNEMLPEPPFKEKVASKEWSEHAVAWFRDDAKDFIKRMWDMVALLKEHGQPVRFIQSDNPGRIVYIDRYQIVADPLLRRIPRRSELMHRPWR
ncbi:MAG TPA: hypothetical protein VKX17_10610 [Planctomycetota bacterium]|nr:hypothetical protein [Planctomycetota bacterium]